MDDREYAEVLRQTMTELTARFARPTELDVTLQTATARLTSLTVWSPRPYY